MFLLQICVCLALVIWRRVLTAGAFFPQKNLILFNLIGLVILFYLINKLWKIFTLFLSGPYIFTNGDQRSKKGNTNKSEKSRGRNVRLKTWRTPCFYCKKPISLIPALLTTQKLQPHNSPFRRHNLFCKGSTLKNANKVHHSKANK